MSTQKKNNRLRLLEKAPVDNALRKLAIPGIIGMLINAIYNVVDSYFVGLLNNTLSLAAVSVSFPIFIIVGAIGLGLGIGGGAYLSKLLGRKKFKEANQVTTTIFLTSIVLGIIFCTLSLIFIKPILLIFGASAEVMPYAVVYSRLIIVSSFFTIINMTLNNLIRGEGNPKYAMIGLIIGACTNIILDPLLMFVFRLGLAGAGYATIIGRLVATIYLLSYFIRNKGVIKIKPKYINLDLKMYFEVMKIGIAMFMTQFLSAVSMILINNATNDFGDAALASIGISLRITYLIFMVVIGYNQGYMPFVAYNYGAKHFDRMNKAKKLAITKLTIFCFISSVILFIFSKYIAMAFSDDPNVIKITSNLLRFASLVMPAFGLQQVLETTFKGLGKGISALILSVSRQGIFLIPLVFILPGLYGILGIYLLLPIPDLLSLILTVILNVVVMRKLKKETPNEIKSA